MMNSIQLEYFLNIARTGSFTAAARNLHLTQPALSKQIRLLEEELGSLLFIRRPHGIRLTPEGRKLQEEADEIIRRIRNQHFDAIVLDPIYKVITGDENNASEMGAFCNQFDKICTATGCAAIYCHHHSKGSQGFKRAMDRASGSGVFARDPDAQLDMIELELTEGVRNWMAPQGATLCCSSARETAICLYTFFGTCQRGIAEDSTALAAAISTS